MKTLTLVLLASSTLAWADSRQASSPAQSFWERLVVAAVRKHLPAQAKVRLERFRVGIGPLKNAKVHLAVADKPLGFVPFEVSGSADGKTVQATGSVVVRALAPVAVASNPISHAQAFDPSNTRFEERELSYLVRSGYFTDLKTVEQRVAKGYVAVGQVIGGINSAPPPLVRQGQTVELVRQAGPLRLSAKVRALQSGLRDQWVQVQNPSTGKLILARVTGSGAVEAR